MIITSFINQASAEKLKLMKVSEGAKKVVLVVVSHFISESLVGEVLEEVRGYHYYAGSAWSNQIIKGFRGATGSVSTK